MRCLACSFGSGATGKGSLPAQAATFSFAHTTPNAEFLAVAQRILKTVFTNDAPSADFFSFFSARPPLGEKEIWINA